MQQLVRTNRVSSTHVDYMITALHFAGGMIKMEMNTECYNFDFEFERQIFKLNFEFTKFM